MGVQEFKTYSWGGGGGGLKNDTWREGAQWSFFKNNVQNQNFKAKLAKF